MRIACLQFAPQVGDVDNNLNRADAILSRVDAEALDLLVLPELAFSGYNFKSLGEISPFLEPSGAGVSSLWSRTTALKYDCTVIAGYPEKVDPTLKWPTNPEYYNAAIVVNGEGETVANYRKTHLYYTDETWALEGPSGFFGRRLEGLGRTAIGICMDLNPYKFEAPWENFEFAHHVLDCGARLVVVSMAWITNDDPRQFSRMPQEPDMNTLMYWVSRFEPIIRAESTEEVVVVFANRTGTEGEVTYAGTSAVIGIKSGEVRVYGILGRGDKELLIVDTDSAPYAKLVYRPRENDIQIRAEQPDEYGHRNDYENNRTQNSQRPWESEDMSGSHQRSGGESDVYRERIVSAKYRRDDLFIHLHSDPMLRDSLESPHIYTPTAPSPTPQSLRPKLMVATSHPNSHRHLNGPSPASLYAGNAAISGPFEILGGDFRFHGSNAHAGISPLAASESRFSESSYESSRLYRTTSKHPPHGIHDSRWTPPDDAEDLIISDGSAVTNNEHRHSIRSDVSVWNNQPGRPPSIGNPLVYQPTPPPETSTRRVGRIAPGRASSANQVIDTARHESFPTRPSSPKSRHASRSREPERSLSAAAGNSDLGAVCQRLEEMAVFSEPSHGRHSSLNRQRSHSNSTSAYQASRSQSRSRKPTPMVQDRSYDRNEMTASIPIAFGLDLVNKSDTRNSSNTSRQQQVTVGPHDLPILRPASQTRIRQRSGSRGRINHRPPSRSTLIQREIRSNTPANFVNRTEIHHRPRERGRQREDRPATDQQAAAAPQTHERRKSANSSQRPPHEPVDLSQYTLIEEYPAPNCPVHGSRSRSGNAHRSSSRNRPATTNSTRPPRQSDKMGRRSTQNTPRPASRKDMNDVVAQPSPKPSKTTKPPQSSPKPNGKTAKIPRVSTTPSNKSKLRNAGPQTADIVKTVVSCEPLDLKSPQGPKTPKAMILVSDSRMEPRELMTPLRCVERSKLGEKPIERPRSAIW